MHFAELNHDGVCIAVTQSASPLVGARFIALTSMDLSVLGKRWTGSEWTLLEI